MVRVIWNFEVRPEFVNEFESVYGPDGDWAQLFRRSDLYRGTELIKKQDSPAIYEVIDHWWSMQAYDAFKAQNRAAYDSLDKECERLTVKEAPMGRVEQE